MTSQADDIARAIERGIADGRFPVGKRLPSERALAQLHAVSRATLREATALLISRGMLHRRQGDGTYVAAPEERRTAEIWGSLSQDHPMFQADLVEFRAMLEIRAAEFAALRHDTTDRERLQQAHAAVDAAYAGSDRRTQIQSDVAFHRAIADATHNAVFSHLSTSLLSLLHGHVQLSLAGLPAHSITSQHLRHQHTELLDAILARDRQRARHAAAEHINFVAVQLNALPRVLQVQA